MLGFKNLCRPPAVPPFRRFAAPTNLPTQLISNPSCCVFIEVADATTLNSVAYSERVQALEKAGLEILGASGRSILFKGRSRANTFRKTFVSRQVAFAKLGPMRPTLCAKEFFASFSRGFYRKLLDNKYLPKLKL